MRRCERRLSWMCVALLLATWAFAQPSPTQRFHLIIQRGKLAAVLEQFSRQTGLQVITQLNVNQSSTGEIGPFVGHATADETLRALLQDTDLDYIWQDEYTLTLYATIVQPPRADDDVQEVIVTGTRLSSDDEPAPVRASGPNKIGHLGVSSVSDLVRYVPQQPFSVSEGYSQSGAQFFQMRGLGFDTTLVLVNGRRMPPSANSIALNAVDLNNLPLMAVERIEVMSDSASSIYGADAIGGVVNIILRDTIEAPEVYLHYGAAKGGGTQERAAVSLGAASERMKSALVLDYYETTALMGEDRELWRNQDYRRYGGLDYRVSATNPGNVYSLTGQPLPGLSSSRAAIPLGTTGPLTPADFFATDGATNLGSSFRDWSITPPSRRATLYGSGEYSFPGELTLFGEVLAEDSESTALRAPPSVTRQIIAASSPFNPFGVPVAVDYAFAGMEPISHVHETELLRVVSGVRGKLQRWEWELAGLRHTEDGTTTTQGDIDRARLVSVVNSSDPDSALNLFAAGSPGADEMLNALRSPAQRNDFSIATSQVTTYIRGPIFSLRGRQAELVFGGEWRIDAAEFTESGRHIDVDRNTTSIFSEIRLPLFDSLTLKFAARADDYGASEPIVNPQYGLVWRLAKDWLVRASYGTSFRPPSLFELHVPTTQPLLLVADPLRAGEVTNVQLMVGGNRDLEAVTARSFTTGFVFNPADIPDLRLGAHYWHVAMDDRIMVPNYQEMLKLENALPGRVVRDNPSETDVQAGWPGRLRSIDLVRVNYGGVQTSGIDFDAVFSTPIRIGCVKFELAATWVHEYFSRDMNQVLPADRVGIANLQGTGTIPQWRVIGGLGWTDGDIGVWTTTTFVPSYQDSNLWTGPLDRRIDSRTVFDLQAWMNFSGDGLLDGWTFTLGARNLFDWLPEFANAGASVGYDMSQGDLTGRFVYARVSKQF